MNRGDFRARLERAARLLSGFDPTLRDYLIAARPGDLFLQGLVAPAVQQHVVQRPSGLLVPAAARRAAPMDQVMAYLVAEETLGMRIPAQRVGEWLSQVSVEHAVSWAAGWIAALERPGAKRRAVDAEFVARYLAEPLRTRVTNLVREPARVLLTPQALVFLIKLAFCLCDTQGPPRDVPVPDRPLVLAVLGIPEHLGSNMASLPDDAEFVLADVPGELGRGLIANQFFNARRSEVGTWAMFQRCWRELTYVLAEDSRVVDLPAAYRAATRVALDDLVVVCAALWAAVTNGWTTVELSYFNTLGWTAERLDGVLRLIAADPQQMRQMVEQEAEQYALDWSVRTFEQFPVVRWPGHLTVLDPRMVIGRASGLWPMYDILRELESRGDHRQLDRIRGCVAHIYEEYALEGVAGMVGLGTGRLYRENDLRAAYRGKVADAAFDYGHSWVVVEVTTVGLQGLTAAGISDESVGKDVDGYVRKARQLDATIDNLRRDEARLTGVGYEGRRRFFPVLVVANRFAGGPVFMTLLRQRLAAVGLLQGEDVAPIEIMEIEDLDVVQGLHEQGGPSLLTLLQEKTASPMQNAAMRDYVMLELGERPSHPERVRSRWKSWVNTAAETLRRAS